jgi:hypothetical protein
MRLYRLEAEHGSAEAQFLRPPGEYYFLSELVHQGIVAE